MGGCIIGLIIPMGLATVPSKSLSAALFAALRSLAATFSSTGALPDFVLMSRMANGAPSKRVEQLQG